MTDFDMIPFFTDDITIVPHTATEARHIGRPVSVRDFCTRYSQRDGTEIRFPCALYQNKDNGEYRLELRSFRASPVQVPAFIEGPETL